MPKNYILEYCTLSMARGCQAQHLIWVVSALSSSILYDIWINLWTVAVFYWDHVYHGRSQQITADHGISQQITADHGRSRHITAYHGKSRQITADHGRSRHITANNGRSRQITADHGRSRQITADHGISRQITADHGRSRQITAYHGRSRQITAYHGRSRQITADYGRSRQITADYGRSRQITAVKVDHGRSAVPRHNGVACVQGPLKDEVYKKGLLCDRAALKTAVEDVIRNMNLQYCTRACHSVLKRLHILKLRGGRHIEQTL